LRENFPEPPERGELKFLRFPSKGLSSFNPLYLPLYGNEPKMVEKVKEICLGKELKRVLRKKEIKKRF